MVLTQMVEQVFLRHGLWSFIYTELGNGLTRN